MRVAAITRRACPARPQATISEAHTRAVGRVSSSRASSSTCRMFGQGHHHMHIYGSGPVLFLFPMSKTERHTQRYFICISDTRVRSPKCHYQAQHLPCMVLMKLTRPQEYFIDPSMPLRQGQCQSRLYPPLESGKIWAHLDRLKLPLMGYADLQSPVQAARIRKRLDGSVQRNLVPLRRHPMSALVLEVSAAGHIVLPCSPTTTFTARRHHKVRHTYTARAQAMLCPHA